MADTNQNHTPEAPGGQRQPPRTNRVRRHRRRPVLLTVIIRLFQLIGTLLLIGIITGGLMVCFAAVYVKTSIMPRTYLDLSDYTLDENSTIYYEDKETGQLVELQTLSGLEVREEVEYNDIPEDLINAFIAVEDKTFREHHGVNWRRTGAGLLYMLTGRSIQGGSTITQQLIKNSTHYDDITVTRKILEIFTALELEKNYEKEDILTIYLNLIFMGNRCRGIQAASKYYFGKPVSELSLAECASLAGITNNPSLYAPYGTVDVVRYRCTNPECKMYSLNRDEPCEYCGGNSFDGGSVWTNREFNKARQELILNLMADPEISPNGAYITEAERDAAIAEPLVFAQDRQNVPEDPEDPDSAGESRQSTVYSWYVEAVINESIARLVEETGLDEELCRKRVFSGGMSILCAYDPDVQAAVDNIYNDRSNLDQVSSRTGQRLMSAISVVDNSTGLVVAMGSTQEKTVNRGWNTPVDTKRQPGSSIKPLSVYAPGIEMGLITPASVVDDSPQLYNGNIWPVNVTPTYGGLTTILHGVTQSLNTVAVRVLDMVTPQASYEFMEDKFGITSLVPYYVDSLGGVHSDMDRSPLAMGGLTRGVSTFEMAAAFATFPRNGMFTEATTVLEIKDRKGTVVLDNRPTAKPAIKETTAYYINSMLTNAVTSGTGYNARISGQTVAGKTGTTTDTFDYWFCGYTSYYTAAVWSGYPNSEVINRNYANTSIPLWQKVMAQLHEGKENSAFPVPDTMNTYSICRDCGKKSMPECEMDVRGSRVQSFRLFPADAPAEFCDCHVKIDVCVDSPFLNGDGEATGRYHMAGEFCPAESVRTVTVVNFERELAKPGLSIGDASGLLSWYEAIPEESRYCTVHTTAEEATPPVESDMPWPSDFPESPTWSVPPFNEPSAEPWVTMEPPQPTFDVIPAPSDEPAYIPADDPGYPDWLRP